MEVLCQLRRLNRQSMEVKGIGSPGEESDEEVEPVLSTELHEERDGVLQWLWRLPFGVRLTKLIGDDDSLLPIVVRSAFH